MFYKIGRFCGVAAAGRGFLIVEARDYFCQHRPQLCMKTPARNTESTRCLLIRRFLTLAEIREQVCGSGGAALFAAWRHRLYPLRNPAQASSRRDEWSGGDRARLSIPRELPKSKHTT